MGVDPVARWIVPRVWRVWTKGEPVLRKEPLENYKYPLSAQALGGLVSRVRGALREPGMRLEVSNPKDGDEGIELTRISTMSPEYC